MTPRSSSSEPRTLIASKKKIGFVCSGGATKAGAFHLGVALALQEQGFKFYGGLNPPNNGATPPGPMDISVYVGSSAGSVICTYLAAGYSVDEIVASFMARKPPPGPNGEVLRELPRLTYPKMFNLRPGIGTEQLTQLVFFKRMIQGILKGDWDGLLHFRWLKFNGLFSTEGIEKYVREEVLPSNQFRDYTADLFVVATQLNHSRKVVFGKYSYRPPPHDLTCQYNNDAPISEAVAASTALPPIYTPYRMAMKTPDDSTKTYDFIDGEIRDSLSSHVAIDAGADLIFASYTHQPYHYMKEIGSLTQYGLSAILVQAIYLLVEQKINNHIHNKDVQRRAILAVDRYLKDEKVSDSMRKRLVEILESELHHNLGVDAIYIHPSAKDTQMFFGDHFSLSPEKMSEIVRSGFRAAIDQLRKYDFADRKIMPAVSKATG